ncbi:uncharacterized protein LOC130915387 isoform X2 [Corythoichthys intestinalis]|uniref:uncharacterized protein LOC130915387 isoform X2 n=1 Tax=Corythoichthys intestinalis TaxID=161448 RepID=UPI0025A67EAE|nr:uncharacterized protein LOC130915387 isoform X2 [Corythoichthys intestinalis]
MRQITTDWWPTQSQTSSQRVEMRRGYPGYDEQLKNKEMKGLAFLSCSILQIKRPPSKQFNWMLQITTDWWPTQSQTSSQRVEIRRGYPGYDEQLKNKEMKFSCVCPRSAMFALGPSRRPPSPPVLPADENVLEMGKDPLFTVSKNVFNSQQEAKSIKMPLKEIRIQSQ